MAASASAPIRLLRLRNSAGSLAEKIAVNRTVASAFPTKLSDPLRNLLHCTSAESLAGKVAVDQTLAIFDSINKQSPSQLAMKKSVDDDDKFVDDDDDVPLDGTDFDEDDDNDDDNRKS